MSLADIIADTDDGLLLSTNRSWSIDDRRLNFQFATEVAREIEGGQLGRLLKNPTYTGITHEFWRACDAVADARDYVMLGTPNCGKGEPGQIAHVGHGVSGARFRNVQVGVGKW
ncbi:MAG: metallopeptidase TldD-related protein, partial [Chloroflexota bacterium]|nr:metallopeptidase TldD-related protein [Chloroflexota bacterium]